AEAYGRQGMLDEAVADLNALLKTRWNKNTIYPVFQSTNKQVVIDKILIERRKELLMRGLRWVDLKRLNQLGADITVSRLGNQSQPLLKANDLRYAMAIPEGIISLTGISQNPR
ncbi:MAG: RagB/SusD family nutrient uptake outer membrane protein, partial [Hymenobacter sp.]